MSKLDSLKSAVSMVGEILDMAALAVAPEYAARRLSARARSGVVAKYDGASRRTRLKRWRGDNSSVNTETGRALSTLRARSRDLVQNNYWAQRAIHVIQRNVVGAGIRPSVKDDEAMERIVRQVCDRTYLDVRGRETLYGIQSNIMHATVENGEVLIIRRRLSRSEMERIGTPIPLQLQVLEADHLDSSKDGDHKGNRIVQGVELDGVGRPVAYWIYPEHPGEISKWLTLESVRIPAEDVIHHYDEKRPGQVRGIPWLAPVLVKIYDWADFDDAQLMRQKIAACWVGFVHTSEMGDKPLYDENGVPEKATPGSFEYLRPGETVSFSSPPGVDGFEAYARTSARAIAAGMDITYESLTGDYSQVNYSSSRMGWLEMHRAVQQWQKHMLLPQFCYRLEEWIREAAAMVGVDSDAPWKWTAPRRPMIDPTRETAASIASIRAGLSSRHQEISERGREPAEVTQEIADDNELVDDLELVLDSDPRKTTNAGQIQQMLIDAFSEVE